MTRFPKMLNKNTFKPLRGMGILSILQPIRPNGLQKPCPTTGDIQRTRPRRLATRSIMLDDQAKLEAAFRRLFWISKKMRQGCQPIPAMDAVRKWREWKR